MKARSKFYLSAMFIVITLSACGGEDSGPSQPSSSPEAHRRSPSEPDSDFCGGYQNIPTHSLTTIMNGHRSEAHRVTLGTDRNECFSLIENRFIEGSFTPGDTF